MGWWWRCGDSGQTHDTGLSGNDKVAVRIKKVEDAVVVGALVGVQLMFASISVLLSYLMSRGLNPLTLVVFSAFATFLVLSPIAILLERNLWPKRFGLKLMAQLVVISFGGVTMFQTLFVKGIQLTSPAMGTAMPNLAPGFIFIIAWIIRLEKVDIGCLYSKVKIAGTLLCIAGALTMSLTHSTAAKEAQMTSSSTSSPADSTFDKQNILGCLYLIAAILVTSSNYVLQALTLGDFPAPISLCAITSLIGSFTTALLQLFEDHRIDLSLSIMSFATLVGFSVLAGAMNGFNLSLNAWAIKKRGPVLVSMFSPISAVCTVIFSFFTTGEAIKLGSLIGMLLIFIGLYSVLWAKGKEDLPPGDDGLESDFDAEKPLLS